MPLKGVIDLGSNTVRLVVYDVKLPDKGKRSEPHQRHKLFRDIVNEKKTAGLSAYVEDGAFTREGIDCAIDVLQGHLRTAANVHCDSVHIFATAVIRNCSNSKNVARRISKAIDMPIDILSDQDEAHLGFVGASCDRAIEEGTLIDIGGGSTELTAVRGGVDTLNASLPQGSVSSYAQCVEMILPRPAECDAMADAFRDKMVALDNADGYKATRVYGIGGSVRAIDKLYAAAFAGDLRPHVLELYQIAALQNLLVTQPSKFAHAATRAVPERLHTIVPGMVIAQTLIEQLGAESLEICKYGIREGYLLERVLKV